MTTLLIFSLLAAAPTPPAEPGPAPTKAVATPKAEKGAEELGLTPEVVQRLSPDQIAQILMERGRPPKPPAVAWIVPLAFFLFVFLTVGAALGIQQARDKVRQGTIRLAIEKGAQIPPELLSPPVRRSDLRRGLTLVGAGIGIAVMLGLLIREQPGAWSVGLVPLLIGVGYLVTWKLEKPAT